MSELIEQCGQLDGAKIAEGAFSLGPSIWLGTRETAHFDDDGSLDVRLTRQFIRRRSELAGDDRIAFRDGASDGLELRLAVASDLEFAVLLVKEAIRANESTAWPGSPPTGEGPAGRRRFQ